MTDLIGIFNADSRKLISYLQKKKKKKKKKSWNKSVKLQFHYSTQKIDDSITTYFPFSKGQFPKKLNTVFT